MSSRTWSRRKPDAGSFARAAAHRAATSAMASASLVGIVLPWLVRIRSVCEANGLRKSAQFDRIVRKSAQVNTCWRMECCQALRPIESADQNLVCLLAGARRRRLGAARVAKVQGKRSGQEIRRGLCRLPPVWFGPGSTAGVQGLPDDVPETGWCPCVRSVRWPRDAQPSHGARGSLAKGRCDARCRPSDRRDPAPRAASEQRDEEDAGHHQRGSAEP